jgi:hypothetical protein
VKTTKKIWDFCLFSLKAYVVIAFFAVQTWFGFFPGSPLARGAINISEELRWILVGFVVAFPVFAAASVSYAWARKRTEFSVMALWTVMTFVFSWLITSTLAVVK